MHREMVRRTGLAFHFGGAVGELLEAVTAQWLLVAPRANPAMLEMYADRDVVPYRDLVPWAGEFAGKYLTSAVQVLRCTGDAGLRRSLEAFVARLVGLQDDDGYLGPWPRGSRLTGRAPNVHGEGHTWDAWGHYHVLLGLLLWAQETDDGEALRAARRIGDLFCDRFLGEASPRLVDTGETDKNLAPAHGLALLYARTGETRYRQLAEQIVGEFAATGGAGEPLAGNYLRQALAGRAFYEMPKPRWESLHPIMALAELGRTTPNAAYRSAFERIWWSIARNDRHNNGGFSSGEQATGNPYHPGAIETCCTIAWMAMSVEMLRLTDDPRVADELEWSTLNAVLAMHARSGRWATYNTPSDGARFASGHQIVFQARAGSPELNCCSVNAPRGLGLLSEWAATVDDATVTVNAYGPSTFRLPLPGGPEVTVTQHTTYPVDGKVEITVSPARAATFTVRLRIPAWSRHTAVSVNGREEPEVVPGSYLGLSRHWQVGDQIVLALDMSLRSWTGEQERAGQTSVYRGPLLLAYDLRYNRGLHRHRDGAADRGSSAIADAPPVRLYEESSGAVVYGGDPWQTTGEELSVPTLRALEIGDEPVPWADWLPPLLLVEARTVDGQTAYLCDFASAGQTGTLYRSWLPLDGDL